MAADGGDVKSPYRLSAVEWLLRVTGADGFTAGIRDFALALDKHSAFSGLGQSDAALVATAIAVDLIHHEDPADSLRQRMRALLSGEDGVAWDDAHAVYQALAIAAQVPRVLR